MLKRLLTFLGRPKGGSFPLGSACKLDVVALTQKVELPLLQQGSAGCAVVLRFRLPARNPGREVFPKPGAVPFW